ncbi:hypothetical protein [Anatilimnocola floriformis]|uniref:hypothetical protein n=1 Tax=Anatilimnocola floriformis TaxID=2948575 RepID=UPI0020C29357|nr:hypothetical protein [Anatilimnocola floriformis]
MSDKPVFVALAEVKPLAGCELDPQKIAGACVRCYVSAKNERLAVKAIRAALATLRYEVVDIEWCVDDAEVEWENPANSEGLELVEAARKLGEVQFGEFHAWTGEEDES